MQIPMQMRPSFRIGALAVAAATTLLAAGCSSGAPKVTPSVKPATPAATAAADVLRAVSTQAERATSATVIIDTRATGKAPMSMHAVMKIRTTPSVAIEMNVTRVSSGSQVMPGGMQEIVTGNALYLKTHSLAAETGKPWVQISSSQLNSRTGNAFSSLMQQISQQDPLSAARMLSASKDVQDVGSGMVDGVPTTHYHGTFSLQSAMNMLTQEMRRLMRQFSSAIGAGKVTFDAWVDHQDQLRKVIESYDSAVAGQVTTSMRFISINQPVSINPPPASEVASLPGMG